MKIKLASENDLEKFFKYLEAHLEENGLDGYDLFQPLTKSQSKLSDILRSKFSEGISIESGEIGWRRLWLAVDEQEEVIGHIDIRNHPEANTQHRVLLGMGIDSSCRRLGLGSRLLKEVISYCESQNHISWLDLWVIASNTAAISLYNKTKFVKTGEIEDMFRIDGCSYGYISMSKSVA